MQYSDTTNNLGIIQSCERYCSLGSTGISGNSALLKDFTANANEGLRRVWHMIFQAYGGWQYDDDNQTNLPSASTDLVKDKKIYDLPAGALTIRGVERMDTGNSWNVLFPKTEEEIREMQAMGEFMKVSATPLYYQVVGDDLRIFPPSDTDVTGGLKIFFDRGSVAFASTATTTTPGFASEYHGILPLFMSIEWLKSNKPTDHTLPLLMNDYAEYEVKLKQYYAERLKQLTPRRFKVRDLVKDYI